MKQTFMKRQGYNYYVMVGTNITYFATLEEAQFYAKQFDAEIKEVW